MKKHRRVTVPGSFPDVYPKVHNEKIGHLTITGGNHIQDNRQYSSHHHDNSQTYNTWDESTVFNSPVSGYIRKVTNAQGPVTACSQATNVSQRLDPEVPRSLRASQLSTPLDIPPINQDESSHHKPSQRARRSTAPQNRDVAGGGKNPGRLTLTGGDRQPSPTSRYEIEAELSSLSPEMQDFVANLELTAMKGRKEQCTPVPATRNPVSPRKHRVKSTQWPSDSNSFSNDGTFAEDRW